MSQYPPLTAPAVANRVYAPVKETYTDAIDDVMVCHIIGSHRLRTQNQRTVEQTVQCTKKHLKTSHSQPDVESVNRQPSLVAMIESAAYDQAIISINTAMIQWYVAMVMDADQPRPQAIHSIHGRSLKHPGCRVRVRITGDITSLVEWLQQNTPPQYAQTITALLHSPHTVVSDWLALEGGKSQYYYHCQYVQQQVLPAATTHTASGYLAMHSLVQDQQLYYYPVWVNHTL